MTAKSPPVVKGTTSLPERYNKTAIALHWLLGLALVAMFCVGLYMTGLPFSLQKLRLYNWHKWAGMTVLALSLLRLLWRCTHRPPALPDAIRSAMPRWQRMAHHGTHALMYILFFIVPLVGWAYSSAAGFSIVYLGLVRLPDFVSVDPGLAELIKPWHEITAYALAALVVLHVAAVIKHQCVSRDGLLARMLPRDR